MDFTGSRLQRIDGSSKTIGAFFGNKVLDNRVCRIASKKLSKGKWS
jgi:hypothetical protein